MGRSGRRSQIIARPVQGTHGSIKIRHDRNPDPQTASVCCALQHFQISRPDSVSSYVRRQVAYLHAPDSCVRKNYNRGYPNHSAAKRLGRLTKQNADPGILAIPRRRKLGHDPRPSNCLVDFHYFHHARKINSGRDREGIGVASKQRPHLSADRGRVPFD